MSTDVVSQGDRSRHWGRGPSGKVGDAVLLLAGLRLCFCRRIRGTELERGRHQNATSCFKRRCFVYVSVNTLTAKEIHTFTSDNEDMEMVEHFGDLGSVIQSDGDGSNARLGKTAKSKDVSSETRAETAHTRVVPVTTCGCEGGQ